MPLKIHLKLLTLASFTLCMLANAETIKFQAPACQTDDLLNEFTRYIIKDDRRGMMQLLQYGDCVIVTEGDNVSLIKRGFSASEIRIDGVKYYVASEAVGQNTKSSPIPAKKIEKQHAIQTQMPQPKGEIKSSKPNLEVGNYVIQAISTESKASAEKTEKLLRELGYHTYNRTLTANEKIIYRVFAQGFKEKEAAIRAKKQIDQSLKANSLVLPYYK